MAKEEQAKPKWTESERFISVGSCTFAETSYISREIRTDEYESKKRTQEEERNLEEGRNREEEQSQVGACSYRAYREEVRKIEVLDA